MPQPYEHQAYPAMRYHRDGHLTTVVRNPTEDEALGPDWHDRPVPAPPARDFAADLAALQEKYAALEQRYAALEEKYAEALILVDEATGKQARGKAGR